LDCSEELGDLVRQYDVTLALSVYYIANARDKVIQCLAESGQYDRIILYAQKVRPEGYVPDWMYILNGLMQTNPPGAASFATKLLSSDVGEGVDVNQVHFLSLSLSPSLSLSLSLSAFPRILICFSLKDCRPLHAQKHGSGDHLAVA